jgi:tetratricopeptide (TPR) repeat protein
MTNNHLLLYRLASLMLEHEQHKLPVDMLFDDSQIGDFVKSIQIDSPYQQMLIEGVLTESVRDEKLYVGFTVEGYFHYLLGEVIYNQTKDQSAEALKIIVEEKKLKGAREGVEQCLIRDVQNDDLKRLMWLIDIGGPLLDICIVPLSSAFLMAYSFYNKDKSHLNTKYFSEVENIFDNLIINQTENDIKVLQRSITHLKEAHKYDLVSKIYQIINAKIKPDKLINACLYVKTIEYIPKENRNRELNNLLEIFRPDVENTELSDFYSIVSEQYRLIENYELALEFIKKSWEILSVNNGRTKKLKIEYFNSLAKIYQGIKNYTDAILYFKKVLTLSIEKYGEHSNSVAVSNASIGFIYLLNKNYDDGIMYIENSIKVFSKLFGTNHINISRTYMMYATALIAKKDFEKAIDIYQKSISFEFKIYGSKSKYIAFLYQAIGAVWEMIKDYNKVIYYYDQSLNIYLNSDQNCEEDISEMYMKIGSIYLNKIKDFSLAVQQFKKSLEINLNKYGKIHPIVSDSLNSIGIAWKGSYQYEKAVEYFKDAAYITIQLNDNQDKNLISNYQNTAFCFNKLKKYEQSIVYYEKALLIVLSHYGDRNKKVGDIYNYIGLNYQHIGGYDSALVNIEKSLSIRIEINGYVDKDVAICYANLASIHFKINNYNKALELFRISLEIKIKIYGENHVELIRTYVNMGKTLTKLVDYHQAIEYFKVAISIQISDDLLFLIAGCYEDLKEFQIAFKFFIESAEMCKSNYGIENDNTKKYSKKCIDFAKIHDMSSSLPHWMKDTEYDI